MRKFFTSRIHLFLVAAVLFLSSSCENSDAAITPEGRLVSNVVIPTAMDVFKGMELTIDGRGFRQGDALALRAGNDIRATSVVTSDKQIVMTIPDQAADQSVYRFVLFRGTEYQVLGASKLTVKLAINVALPATITAERGATVTISGNGFAAGDKLRILQGEGSYDATIADITDSSISFVLPANIVAGGCELQLMRGDETMSLGTSKLSLTVPDKAGATIKGIVVCDGIGVSDVLVSDGDLFTKTDKDGYYWLESKKRNSLVFVILPSGYDVPTEEAMPQFWQPCTLAVDLLEQVDFQLSKTSNDAYTLLVATDIHLANRNNDLTQFANGFVSELKAAYNTSSKKVYCLNLGDFSWDGYWYEKNWMIPECKNAIKDFNFQVWSIMGNHDNDAHTVGATPTTDFTAEIPYRTYLGPVYYSMNFGQVHYIMLDDTDYINTGGTTTTNGEREYNRRVTDEQIAWLKQDLSYVSKSTPIVVAMHCPIYSYSTYGNVTVALQSSAEVSKLLDCFVGYDNVQVVSGHTHVNRNMQSPAYPNVYEQNIAAVCGTWWWTNGYAGNNVCTDGSPAGYKVFDINGTDLKWQYKAVGLPASRQFTTYDMNSVKSYWATDATAEKAFASGNLAGRDKDYATVGDNVVYINVWDYEVGTTIAVTENGKALDVKQNWATRDPLHTISYDIPRGVNSSLSFPSSWCFHMFYVTATSASSTLEITVTDRFGNTSKESMKRPKAFTTSLGN